MSTTDNQPPTGGTAAAPAAWSPQHSRADYLAGRCSHQDYYGQFVDDPLRALVSRRFGVEALRAALVRGDTSFNRSIPLREWDGLSLALDNRVFRERLKAAGDFYSTAGAVCALKEAARQVASSEQHEEEEGYAHDDA